MCIRDSYMIASIPMAQQVNHALPAGYQLDEYRIEHQLSLGGFSIVYLATDNKGEFVAIKEYLPNSLALSGEGAIKPLILSLIHIYPFPAHPNWNGSPPAPVVRY